MPDKPYEKFDDWYYELEGFGMRCERVYADVYGASEGKPDKRLKEWLEVAWQMGRESKPDI